ncbi:hypothetical protein PHLGIDRAFT_173914 [Phlebiopsis gigantea 11061_1 CR5-6]|uniref:Major facilitator superfamily (MFS) profile domain-containing protein n=1 Tax=Phlebiopsis gigantea (strain 11061_1 CR5-6) TaxID=745531 RepID=A0A0C3PTX0_PHLG1|nr:hypothetical protein PHLGIDRAFT_173914 [Phlebiopsis gigantea 11061_1 CR5-6]
MAVKQRESTLSEKPRYIVVERSLLNQIILVATCTTAMILNTGSSSAAAIALPTIGDKLHIVEYKLQWILSAYALSAGCLLLLFGRLADLYGRKLVFLFGVLCLAVFSLGCGFAHNEITIDVLRGLQGIGGAAVVPAALGILAHAFPPSRARAIAFSTFAAGAPMGGAIGSVIGGVLTQLTGATWCSVFFLFAGLGAACFVAGLMVIDKDTPSTEKDRRVDWLGAFLVTAGLVLIVFVLSDGSIAPNGFATSYIIAFIVIGVILLIMFIFWQHYLEKIHDDPEAAALAIDKWWTPPPLMKLSIWTRMRGRMAVMLWIAFLEWCSFFSWQLWVQLYYQNFLHLTPVLTMVRLLPMFVTGMVCNLIVALVVGRVDVVFLIVAGTALTATANLLFAVINVSSPYWAFGFPSAILSVFGADFVFAAGTLFVAKISLPHEQSLGGALFQTMTQLGSSFGLSITTIIYNSVLTNESKTFGVAVNKSGTNAPRSAQLDAYKAAMWGGFAFGIIGAVLAALFLRHVGIVGHQKEDDIPDEERTAHVPEGDAQREEKGAEERQ